MEMTKDPIDIRIDNAIDEALKPLRRAIVELQEKVKTLEAPAEANIEEDLTGWISIEKYHRNAASLKNPSFLLVVEKQIIKKWESLGAYLSCKEGVLATHYKNN